jgi:hypothetical protein
MSSHKNHEHLEKIKDAIQKANHLSEEEKSATLKRVEEWIKEDKADGIFYEELVEISNKIKPILSEIGLI